jgi:23S rRNA (adenine2503-C2)-methyltransferase
MTASVPAVVAASPINLFGLDREALRALFVERGEKPFRADQVMQWIYRRGLDNFDGMSNVAKDLRERMKQWFTIRTPELVTEQTSADGTRKWVLRLDGGNAVETVYIPEADRGTLCISSQVGCAMDCSFCSTGKQGFNRNMSTAEIIAQVWFAAKALGGDFQSDWKGTDAPAEQNGRVISNVVFMGMGEPLANYQPVVTAIRILLDDFGFGLSKRRVTVSTSGLVPFIDRLRDDVDVALAVSLHAPNDGLRDRLVPINRKYPLTDLMDACRRYTVGKERKAHIVYEYVMLEGVNDSLAHAKELARLIGDMPAKVNLIPFNPFPQAGYKRSPQPVVRAFAEYLRSRRIVCTTRKTRGDDIDAACGQLVGEVMNKQKQKLGDIAVRRAA